MEFDRNHIVTPKGVKRKMSSVTDRLRAYYKSNPQVAIVLVPPAPLAVVEATESRLGFALPPILRELYITLSNGGFGPDVMGLPGGFEDEDEGFFGDYYLALYPRPNENDAACLWPEKLVPFSNSGCGSYSCVDCSHPNAPVVGFDPNAYNPEEGLAWSDVFVPEAASLEEWLSEWLTYEA
jgi:hypothetical protein